MSESGGTLSLVLQIAQSRSYLYTLGHKVGIICVLAALGSALKDILYRFTGMESLKKGSGWQRLPL